MQTVLVQKTGSLQNLVTLIAQRRVDSPDSISVGEMPASQAMVPELRASKRDIGEVIGRQRRTANTLRSITNAVSTSDKKTAIKKEWSWKSWHN